MANENLEGKRWFLAMAGVVIMLILGTVYAWSVFVKPIAAAQGWEVKMVSRVFMLIIGVI
ncbi:MAG: OFA family MFS transporter, partial [Syntrophaceae bacterium]|nr:OFA family MFS transporter [Syntrophaceae bacterium]